MRQEDGQLFAAERDGCGVRKGQHVLKRVAGRWQLTIPPLMTYEQALYRFITLPDDFTLFCGQTREAPSMGVIRAEMRRALSDDPDKSPLRVPDLPDGRLIPNLEAAGQHWLRNGLITAIKCMEVEPEDQDYQLSWVEFNGDNITLHYKQSDDKPAAPDVHVQLKKHKHHWKPREFSLDKGPGCVCGYRLKYVEDENYVHTCG